MTREDFVARYGNIYEGSPWVAQRAWDGGAQEGDDLAAVFRRIVERAEPEAHLRLLRTHADVGLPSKADEAGREAFDSLRERYRSRFGFPFVVAGAGLRPLERLQVLRERVAGDSAHEFRTGLDEVHKIAAAKLEALAAGDSPAPPAETVDLSDLRGLVEQALANAGADAANVRAIADTVMAAERDGSTSHGVFRVAGYARALRSGFLNGTARPRILEGPDAAVIADGDGGAAQGAYSMVLPLLAERATAHGAGVLCLRNAVHYAAMWHEVEWLASRGLAGLACTANFPYVAPHGGRRPFFGTNPIAFAFPKTDGPVVFDIAVSTMARGDVMIAARDGHTVPPGVGVDETGMPTRDPAAILRGAQSAFGGHKGSALALMVELLAAGVVNDMFSDEASAEAIAGGVPCGGVFVLALSPVALGGPDALSRADRYLSRLAAEPGVRLPGVRRHRRRNAGGDYTVPVSVMEELRALAAQR